MKRIGLLSDTHGYLSPKMATFFGECDEVWHAGDIGDISTLEELSDNWIVRAVFGNIDGEDIRRACPLEQVFLCEQLKVYMIHIGGYPGRYNPQALRTILNEKPGLFISGHSHILKVIWDKKHGLLHLNPGAAGNSGLHKVLTMMRFNVVGREIEDLEIFETPRK
jgi:putative phosphoesterase